MQYLRVRNFEKFQHYKDRTPPWIKLYNDILDDYEFSCLQDASKLHLILIWLLASRTDNKFPSDPAWVQRKIMASEQVDLDALLAHGFLEEVKENQPLQSAEQDASKKQATRNQNARPEREGEREGETEETYPQELNEEAWRSYIQYRKESKLKKLTRQGEQIKIKWLIKQGDHLVQQKIIEHSISNGYTGLFELKQGVSHGTHQQDNSAVGRVRRANGITDEPSLKDIN